MKYIPRIAVLIYLGASVGIWIYASLCSWQWCGLLGVLPFSPWIQLFETADVFRIDIPAALLPVFFVCNLFILYGIGMLISHLAQNISLRRK